MDLTHATLSEISGAVKTKKVSAVEVAKHFRKRIENLDGKLKSFISLNDNFEKEAQAIDQKISKGEEPGLLAGVPFGIKDLLCTKGLKTTAASKILSTFVPPYDATVVSRLRNAGSVVMGKTNLDEFAMGSSNETSFFGPCHNPWGLDRTPGGSSGGSGAAQASRIVAATIGTDTGGSIRQPANFCGVVGVKPTYGRVSRYGIVAYASSLDQAGPMVSTVADAALVMEVICGKDSLDSTTSSKPVPKFSKDLSKNIQGYRIGLMKEYMTSNLHPDVKAAMEKAVADLKAQGAEIVEVSAPLTEHAIPIYYLIATSEASSNLARYDGVKYGYRAEFKKLSDMDLDKFYSRTRGEGFGKEVQRRIILGTYCLSSGYYDAYYNKSCQVRRLLKDQFMAAFSKCDVILSPVTTSPAFKIGERISDPLAMYMNDIFTTSTNLAGLPGMSVPFSLSKEGLPIGLQLTAAHFEEQKMLNVAQALEDIAPAKGKKPNVI
jgi:aspartyl-tRNA(Asn)/glutamyl-tRNA(Gln) amidotransferase subunit A